MNDKAIEFESTKFKVLKTINKLKDIGLNIDKYQNIYHNIISGVNNSNKNISKDIINSPTNFATDCLVANYSKAIKDLNLLLDKLQTFEIYIKVASFTTYLKVFIKNQIKTPADFKFVQKN